MKKENLLISLEAVGTMMVESYKGGNCLETGGIGIGPKNHKNVITDVIPSTAYAERNVATYFQSEKDIKILNKKLREYQAEGYDFKAYWHKHPSGLFYLSYGDHITCKEILQSPNYHVNNYLLMLIITDSHKQDFPLFSYSVSLDENKNVVVQEMAVKILPKHCILECAECFEPLPTNEVKNHENIITGQGNEKTGNNGKQEPDISLRTPG